MSGLEVWCCHTCRKCRLSGREIFSSLPPLQCLSSSGPVPEAGRDAHEKAPLEAQTSSSVGLNLLELLCFQAFGPSVMDRLVDPKNPFSQTTQVLCSSDSELSSCGKTSLLCPACLNYRISECIEWPSIQWMKSMSSKYSLFALTCFKVFFWGKSCILKQLLVFFHKFLKGISGLLDLAAEHLILWGFC